MDQENCAGDFHDSELGDVYDLYNACNGKLDEDGRLDLSRLDELDREESEVFDVERLREVWRHAAGCAECEEIVRILNSARRPAWADSEQPAPVETCT
jgi:hypothetical protein